MHLTCLFEKTKTKINTNNTASQCSLEVVLDTQLHATVSLLYSLHRKQLMNFFIPYTFKKFLIAMSRATLTKKNYPEYMYGNSTLILCGFTCTGAKHLNNRSTQLDINPLFIRAAPTLKLKSLHKKHRLSIQQQETKISSEWGKNSESLQLHPPHPQTHPQGEKMETPKLQPRRPRHCDCSSQIKTE